MRKILLALMLLLTGESVLAVNSVSPSTVTVSATGVSRALLAYRGTAGQKAVDGFWCGDIVGVPNTPTSSNPCVSGTLFGHLPQNLELGATLGGTAIEVTTDLMTVPASIARLAYQDAERGNESSFFYIRKFVDADTGGNPQYIATTLRLAASSAGAVFSLKSIQLRFSGKGSNAPILYVQRDGKLPSFGATLRYNGSGRIKGRWEIIKPGEGQEVLRPPVQTNICCVQTVAYIFWNRISYLYIFKPQV